MTPRWHRFALSAVATAVLGLHSLGAQALSLGPVVIQSALGEALRAEIDILEMNAEEAASLKTQIASPEAFRAAGLDYNAAMANTRVAILRRANGRSYIRLTSDRPVNEPFVDMILEATWSGGRIVRDYTMLLDPPVLRAAMPTTAPQVVAQDLPAATAPAAAPMAVATQAPVPAASPVRPAAPRPAAGTSAKAPPAAMPAKPAAAPKPGDKQVTVKAGDNASKIALASKASNVSLDQMLVALLRANPDAFINGNLNRLKSGTVLNLPGTQDALATDNAQARQIVVAQSRDFGEFRNKLAGLAPTTQVATADRQAAGGVQSRVDDKKPAASAPDKLTLSKGGVQAKAQADQVAKNLSAKEAASQKAEVSKTIAELSKVAAAVPAAKTSAPAVTTPAATPAIATKPAPTTVAPAVVAAVAQPAAAPASAATPAQPAVAASAAPAPVATPAKPAIKAPPPPPPEPSLIDKLTENPLIPAAGAALVALLAGFGLWRVRQRKSANEQDSAFLDSRLQPDSFFGSSGGQRVDTNETGAGTSIVYSPSQLDAADDVDPVAEADVYLAYGRDLQAEEILKEALKTHGGRLSVHQKLLEIYGKRRDTRNFELTANEAYKLTAGEGQDWVRICEQGLSIDPGNPLYMPGGKPSVAVGIPSQPMPLEMQNAFKATSAGSASTMGTLGNAAAAAAGLATVAMAASAVSTGSSTSPLNAQPAAQGVDLDFDLDLDFSLDDDNAKVITDMTQATSTSKIQAVDSGSVPLDMDFDMPEPVKPAFATQTAAFKAPSLEPVKAPVVVDTKPGVIEFELDDLPGAALSNSGEISRPAPLESMDTLMPLEFEPPAPVEASVETKKEPSLSLSLLDDVDEFKQEAARSFGTTQTGPLSTFAPKLPESDATTGAMELMDFNIGNLPLDMGDGPPNTQISDDLGDGENPLATKLSLAEEFNSIGDTDGARALIEEVVQEATGDLRIRAQKALAALA
jgi:pilus assembly protein FimV